MKPPRAPGLPLIGNLLEVRRLGLLPFLEKSWRALGDVFLVDVGFPAVVVAHPEGIKQVLAGHAKQYVKGSVYDGVRRIIGNGVLALEGEAWKSRRTLMQPAFHRSALGKLTDSMVETGAAYFSALATRHGPQWFELDAHRAMVTLTLDVVTAALFGRELRGATTVSYETWGAALELVSERGNAVVLPAWVPLPHNRRFHRVMGEVDAAVREVITAGRARPPDQGTLLSMLMHSTDATTGHTLTDTELRDEIFTLFVAGHETTALTLTWLFTLLEGQPLVLSRMVHEVDTVLGGREPSFADVAKLTFVRNVVDETLRLRGPVAMNARNALEDDVLLGHHIAAGTTVMPFFFGAHRHPDFWADPETFDPDRFTSERSQGRHPWAYVPFSSGQRRCIGDQFSLVETVVLLSQLLQRFEVEVLPGQGEVKPVAMVTVRPDRPVRIRLKARRA